jgi:hypothetical protein
LSTSVCASPNAPVSNNKPPHEEGGGGVAGGGGGGLPDGSYPDGGLPDGSTGGQAGCFFCGGSADLDAGCPTGWTQTLVTTQTAVVCVCEDENGDYGCQFCSFANPANGGCEDGGTCTDICAPGGYFSYCVAAGVTVPDECYLHDGG